MALKKRQNQDIGGSVGVVRAALMSGSGSDSSSATGSKSAEAGGEPDGAADGGASDGGHSLAALAAGRPAALGHGAAQSPLSHRPGHSREGRLHPHLRQVSPEGGWALVPRGPRRRRAGPGRPTRPSRWAAPRPRAPPPPDSGGPPLGSQGFTARPAFLTQRGSVWCRGTHTAPIFCVWHPLVPCCVSL